MTRDLPSPAYPVFAVGEYYDGDTATDRCRECHCTCGTHARNCSWDQQHPAQTRDPLATAARELLAHLDTWAKRPETARTMTLASNLREALARHEAAMQEAYYAGRHDELIAHHETTAGLGAYLVLPAAGAGSDPTELYARVPGAPHHETHRSREIHTPYVPEHVARECLRMLEDAGMGTRGSPYGNTLHGMVKEACAIVSEYDRVRSDPDAAPDPHHEANAALGPPAPDEEHTICPWCSALCANCGHIRGMHFADNSGCDVGEDGCDCKLFSLAAAPARRDGGKL